MNNNGEGVKWNSLYAGIEMVKELLHKKRKISSALNISNII